MTFDSGTRWLPEPLKLRLKVATGVPPSGPTTGCHQPQSFGRRRNGGRALQKSRVVDRLKLLRTLTAKKPRDSFNANHAVDNGTSDPKKRLPHAALQHLTGFKMPLALWGVRGREPAAST